MIQIFALLVLTSIVANAQNPTYQKGRYEADVVNAVNKNSEYTGTYVALEQNAQQSASSTVTQSTSTQETSLNSVETNGVVRTNPVVVREKSYYSPYRSYGKKIVNEPRFGAMAKIGIGGQYLNTPSVNYVSSNVASTILSHSHTYMVVPVGLEFIYNVNRRHALSLNADYYLNPFRGSVEKDLQNVRVFEAKTNFMIYGKYAYRLNKSADVHLIGGITQMDFDVYNDLTGTIFFKSQSLVPTIGLGTSLFVTNNASIFLDLLYFHVGQVDDGLIVVDKRLRAIADKQYTGVQVRIGFAYNFGRAMANK